MYTCQISTRALHGNSQQDKNAPYYSSTATQKNKERDQCQDHETSHAVTTFMCTLSFLDRQTRHHQHISVWRTTLHSNRDNSSNHFPFLPTRDQSVFFFPSHFRHTRRIQPICEHMHPCIMAICSFPAGTHLLKGHNRKTVGSGRCHSMD